MDSKQERILTLEFSPFSLYVPLLWPQAIPDMYLIFTPKTEFQHLFLGRGKAGPKYLRTDYKSYLVHFC